MSSTGSNWLYRWTRELHLYFGLFICPFLLLFAVTTILLNHGWRSGTDVDESSVSVRVEGGDEMAQASNILRQLDLSGEVHARRLPERNRLQVRVEKPSERVVIMVDLASGVANVARHGRSFVETLNYLHFNPGPHKVRGINWFFSKLWDWSVDAVVCLLLFISISGIYMWFVIKAERKMGLIMLGTGSVSFVVIVAGFFIGG